MTQSPTIEQQLDLLRSSLPMNKNNIKTLVVVGKEDDEVVGLQIYSPPILMNDNLNLVRGYIRRLGLDLVAEKGGEDGILVKSAAKIKESVGF